MIPLANTSSAKKRVRVQERKRTRNTGIRTAIKTAFRRANEAITGKGTEPETAVKKAVTVIDKAAAKGIVHKNRAARKKSRLMRKQHQAKAGK